MKSSQLISYLRAGFPAFWLRTQEPNRVRQTVYEEIKNFERKDGSHYTVNEWTCVKEANPMAALTAFDEAEPLTVLFAHNFHWYADKPQIVQMILDNIPKWSGDGKAFIVVSPHDKIPFELEKEFVLVDLPLPSEDDIIETVQVVAPAENIIPKDEELFGLISSCKGLTEAELRRVLSLSCVKADGKGFDIPTINEYKAMAIRKTGFLDVLESNLTFNDVVGYDVIKKFVLETIHNPKAKGIMTIGPPGCGKTTLMKAIVGETGKFGLSVNMGKLFSKYQGETDQNINKVIEIITAIGDCLVLIDEFEKQFAGSSSDGSLDSGTTRRATGRWLDFLQNRPKGVYIVGTANSFEGIPGEYLRPGRWDTSPFFIDLPSNGTRKSILEHYLAKSDVPIKKSKGKIDLKDFSGAEIEALVHIADMRGIPLDQAVKAIIPQARTMAERVDQLRKWAQDRTIPAESAEEFVETKGVRLDI